MSDSDFMYSDEENEFDFMESEDNQFEEFEGDEMEDDMDYLEDYIHSSNPNSQSTEAKKKANHIEYETYDFNWVLQKQIEEAKHVSDIYGLAPYTATNLLRHFKWKKEKLLEQFAEDPDTILSKSGAIYDKDPKECTIDRNIPGFLCPVCYSEDSSVQSFKLPCGHRFCIECFEHYLNDKILSMEGHGIKCMEACSYKLDDSIIKLLVSQDNFKR
jgi:ariadne-1